MLRKFPKLRKSPIFDTKVPFFRYKSAHSYGSLSPSLSLSLFSATSRPFLSSLPFFLSRTRHRGCQAKARLRARNILAQLCFAPDDSQHYRSLGVDASFFLPYPGIPILLHTLSILLLLPFSFNSNKTIFVKLITLINR